VKFGSSPDAYEFDSRRRRCNNPGHRI